MNEIQNEVLYKLGRIEASLDEIKTSQANAVAALDKHAKDDAALFQEHGARIQSLELSRAKALGGAAAVSGIVGTVVALLAKTLHLT